MIPKIIHYCWFGGNPLPPLAKKCIASWKKFCPDYEIKEWNESNFDININNYVKEAYDKKKYAFVTDYVRLYALYRFGGIYMDTDVEVNQPLDDFLNHRAFTGCENQQYCVTGIIAAEKEHPWIKDLLDGYKNRSFILSNGDIDTIPNTEIITKATIERYEWNPVNEYQVLKEDLHIYPFSVFCAKDFKTGRVVVTHETYTVHHFSGSWHSKSDKLKMRIIRLLGPKLTRYAIMLKRRIGNRRGEKF